MTAGYGVASGLASGVTSVGVGVAVGGSGAKVGVTVGGGGVRVGVGGSDVGVGVAGSNSHQALITASPVFSKYSTRMMWLPFDSGCSTLYVCTAVSNQ